MTSTARALAAAFALAAASLASTPALAAPGYSAILKSPLDAPKHEIINGVLWKCAGDSCAAPAQGSRPLLICQKIAKKLGPVARFASPEGELAQDELARCNG